MAKRPALKRPALNSFVRGYIEAALWSSTDEDEQPLDRDHSVSDIATPTLRQMVADCLRFQRATKADLDEADISDSSAGHDFWLSRNGHGTGFWDRGLGAVGNRLHAKAKSFGEFDLYLGDDGKVHGS